MTRFRCTSVSSAVGVREKFSRELTISLARKRLPRDFFQYAGLLLVLGDLLGQHLRVCRDHGERRVDLVGHARGEQSDARQLVGLHKAPLEFRRGP